MGEREDHLPPREDDALLIDALRLNPKTDLGKSLGEEVQTAISDASDLSTDEYTQVVDKQRANLHNIVEKRSQLAKTLSTFSQIVRRSFRLSGYEGTEINKKDNGDEE